MHSMNAAILTAGAALLAIVAGCGGASDPSNNLDTGRHEATRRYCNVQATEEKDDVQSKHTEVQRAEPECYDTFAESIAAATHGAVTLAADATPQTLNALSAPQSALLGTYLLGIEYIAPRWDGFWGYYNVTAQHTCDDGYSMTVWLEGSWLDNAISSSRAYEGCAHAYHYDGSFSGSRIDCGPPSRNGGHDPCYYDLGAMTDRATTIRYTNRLE